MLPEEGGAGWSAGGVGWEKERPAGFMPTKWWWAMASAARGDAGERTGARCKTSRENGKWELGKKREKRGLGTTLPPYDYW